MDECIYDDYMGYCNEDGTPGPIPNKIKIAKLINSTNKKVANLLGYIGLLEEDNELKFFFSNTHPRYFKTSKVEKIYTKKDELLGEVLVFKTKNNHYEFLFDVERFL